jgi:hypothetical protein
MILLDVLTAACTKAVLNIENRKVAETTAHFNETLELNNQLINKASVNGCTRLFCQIDARDWSLFPSIGQLTFRSSSDIVYGCLFWFAFSNLLSIGLSTVRHPDLSFPAVAVGTSR